MDQGYEKRLEERLEIMDAHPPESIGSGPEVNPAIEELYAELMMGFLHIRFPSMFELQEKTLFNKVTGKSYSLDMQSLSHNQMLRNLGENVEEDFYFMCPDEDDEPRLQGWLACFPGGFLTTSRKGMSMREIHNPVPGYQKRIGNGADKVLARLEGGQFIERFNVSNCCSPNRGHSNAVLMVMTSSGVCRLMDRVFSASMATTFTLSKARPSQT